MLSDCQVQLLSLLSYCLAARAAAVQPLLDAAAWAGAAAGGLKCSVMRRSAMKKPAAEPTNIRGINCSTYKAR